MPRYGPAVLRALAAYDEAVVPYEALLWVSPSVRDEDAFLDAWAAFETAEHRLWEALAAERSRAVVPVLPDESERAAQPHRFGGIL